MRKPLDAYYTPEKAVESFLQFYPHVKMDSILEPCCGTKNISKMFKNCVTADIDPSVSPMLVGDMSQKKWRLELEARYGHHDWVITNPPFSAALEFARYGLEHCKFGMALLLRLSFLEPTFKRQEWLSQNPPNRLIVLPRISFTGDGKHDSVTCGWMIWQKGISNRSIEIVRK